MRKRIIAMICVFVLMFTGTAVRCFIISVSSAYTVSQGYNSYTINLGHLYTNLYDCKGELLNNNTKSLVAIIRPNEKCMSELKLLFHSDEVKKITKELSKGYPVVKKIDKYAKTKYIKIVETIEENGKNMLARHMLDKNYGGLEQYVSTEIGSLSVNFSVDALGRILSGDEGTLIDNDYDSRDGEMVSINGDIQKIAEDAAKTIPKGAVVVMNIENAQILASVSRGDDYINRAVSAYAVGSVFKLVVCASALENRISPLYRCTSSITVGDTTFHCQKNHSHGIQSMRNALANSCNCYFVNLALKIGRDKLYQTAKKLGFAEEFNLFGEKWTVKAGTFPTKNDLLSAGQLALIGFGQGKLTDSPVHFASVISCFANGGHYNYPTLDLVESSENTTIDSTICNKILKYMRYVVSNGTGFAADYKNAAAGKTATAQSGTYVNGREVLLTWFAGIYPYEYPKYAIVVMRENGSSGAEDCCPVFRTIVEKLNHL